MAALRHFHGIACGPNAQPPRHLSKAEKQNAPAADATGAFKPLLDQAKRPAA